MLCPNNCEGYELGKCPICHCKCSLLVEINMYCDMCVLASIEDNVEEAEASLRAHPTSDWPQRDLPGWLIAN
jgi:hypothetical protein